MKHYHITDIRNYPTYTVLDVAADDFTDEMHFTAGQYATIAYKPGWRWTPARCLSFSSSPDDSAHIQFAFRRSGAYTQGLSHMRPGAQLLLQGPFGDFNIIDSSKDNMLFAGGIGVTPFLSMFREAARRPEGGKLILILSVSKITDIPFHEELEQLRTNSDRISVYYFVSEPIADDTPDNYIQGPFNEAHARSLELDTYHYYLCGPEGYMESVTDLLAKHGVEDFRITSESFNASEQQPGQAVSIPKMTYALSALLFLLLTGSVAAYDIAKNNSAANTAATTTESTTTDTTGDIPEDDDTTAASPSTPADPSLDTAIPETTTPETTTPDTDTTVPQTYTPPVSRVS